MVYTQPWAPAAACARRAIRSCIGPVKVGLAGFVLLLSGCSTEVHVFGTAPLHVSLVAVGNAHTCAIDDAKECLYCWGDNTRGQLGVEDNVGNALRPMLVDCEGWIDIAAGALHTCGLRHDRTMWCWGDNSDDQLGVPELDGPDLDKLTTPSQVILDESLGRDEVEKLALGEDHTCALLEANGGPMVCMGRNSNGQLGIGEATPFGIAEPTVVVSLDAEWIDVSSGSDHTCGIRREDDVHNLYCWGRNEQGSLGIGTDDDDLFFARPVWPVEGSQWEKVSAGPSQTCAMEFDGSLWCWGTSDAGVIGHQSDEDITEPVELEVESARRVEVIAGDQATCTIDRDGVLACTGSNSSGRFGLSETGPLFQFTEILAVGVTAAAIGPEHICAVTADSELLCSGGNHYGQLGVGDTQQRSAFTRVPDPEPEEPEPEEPEP